MNASATTPAALDIPDQDRLALIVLAVLQSLALLALHKSLTHEVWPATSPTALYALYSMVLLVPFFLVLGAVRWRDRFNAIAASALALACLWLGWHAGWLAAAEFADHNRRGEFVFPLACGLVLATFVFAVHFRVWRETGRLDYAALIDHSWRNALTLGFLGAFLLVFWLLLNLWGELFELIGIGFFKDLFYRSEFVYPVFGLVGGWGLGLIRARVGMIATVRHLCETLTRALLPIVSFIVVIFLGALPFTGLESLWRTGHASALLLSLAAVQLFFFVAVLSDADEFRVHPWLKWLVLGAQVLVPINALLAAWALSLRVVQYGWSVERLWGAFVISFVLAYALAYAITLLWQRGAQVAPIRRVNIVIGLTLAGALLLVNSPLVEFHRITANDQAERVRDGRTKPRDFDGRYLRFELGPYGVATLDALAADPAIQANQAIARQVTAARAMTARYAEPKPVAIGAEELRIMVGRLPGTAPDDAFYAALAAVWGQRWNGCQSDASDCVVGALRRGERDYLVLFFNPRYPNGGLLWRQDRGTWRAMGRVGQVGCDAPLDGKPDADGMNSFGYMGEGIKPLDLSHSLTPVESEFFLFRNGDCHYDASPERDGFSVPRKP